MDRNALLLYLRDIRDLEVAKYRTRQLGWDKDNEYRILLKSLSDMKTMVVPDKKGLGKLMFWGIITAIATVIAIWIGIKCLSVTWWTIPLRIFMLILVAVLPEFLILAYFWEALSDYKLIKRMRTEAINNNSAELARVQENAENIEKVKDIRSRWNIVIEKRIKNIDEILQKEYSLNILPNQYRNIESIYYIYDYMSSSQASLEDTLMHEHMENGIQRILAKLDDLIATNRQIIFQNRILEASNQKMISQNEKMITSLRNSESNTALAAQYAGIAAGYSAANAYFSAANYLVSTSKR